VSAFKDSLPQKPGGYFGSREVTQVYAAGDDGKWFRENDHMTYDSNEERSVVGNFWIYPPDGPAVTSLDWAAMEALEAEQAAKPGRIPNPNEPGDADGSEG
jgi:hypothetical protein